MSKKSSTHEAEVERLDEVPADLARHLQGRALELGLYAANMPEALGGGGLNNFDITLMERELGRASYGLQMLVARPSNILRACQGAQIEEYLLPTISGVPLATPSAVTAVRRRQLPELLSAIT